MIEKQMKKILENERVKELISKGYEYFTITEGGKITAIHFYKGV